MAQFTINLFENRVWRGSEEVILSYMQLNLFVYLVRNRNRFCPSAMIYERVWGNPVYDFFHETHSVVVMIHRLRNRLNDNQHCIIQGRKHYGYMVDKECVELIE